MIRLTDGYYAYVDATDFEELKQWHWHARNGYAARYENGKPIYMHRQIMQTAEEWPPERRARVYAEAQAKRKGRRAKAVKTKRRKGQGDRSDR